MENVCVYQKCDIIVSNLPQKKNFVGFSSTKRMFTQTNIPQKLFLQANVTCLCIMQSWIDKTWIIFPFLQIIFFRKRSKNSFLYLAFVCMCWAIHDQLKTQIQKKTMFANQTFWEILPNIRNLLLFSLYSLRSFAKH